MPPPSEFAPPLIVAAAMAGVAVLASWRASRPADPLKPRMIPWRALMILAAGGAIVALAMLAALFNVDGR
ncbi:MAG: hypothetical protein GC206_04085 [Alphaproteobacteria bacterium]|nr:hypothetical protein [Alphaproteobacteria bacterium]